MTRSYNHHHHNELARRTWRDSPQAQGSGSARQPKMQCFMTLHLSINLLIFVCLFVTSSKVPEAPPASSVNHVAETLEQTDIVTQTHIV